MISNEYLTADSLYASAVWGKGLYRWDGQLIPDPLAGEESASPLLINVISGETFFVRRFDFLPWLVERYRQYILSPPERESILWPADMLQLPAEVLEPCSVFVAHQYSTAGAPQSGTGVLLFHSGEYPKLTGIEEKMAGSHGWRDPAVRAVAVQMVRAVEALNRDGDVYQDFHLSRFFLREDGGAFLDFSNLVYTFNDFTVGEDGGGVCSPSEYPIEFAEPAYVRGQRLSLDFHSQNYSLCALLFYLLLGRYPYDGRLLSGHLDTDAQQHELKFQYYHRMPVFIFDPDNRQNTLGKFSSDRWTTGLWKELPERLKELFLFTLNEGNATRTTQVCNPPPAVWLKRFREEGWP